MKLGVRDRGMEERVGKTGQGIGRGEMRGRRRLGKDESEHKYTPSRMRRR